MSFLAIRRPQNDHGRGPFFGDQHIVSFEQVRMYVADRPDYLLTDCSTYGNSMSPTVVTYKSCPFNSPRYVSPRRLITLLPHHAELISSVVFTRLFPMLNLPSTANVYGPYDLGTSSVLDISALRLERLKTTFPLDRPLGVDFLSSWLSYRDIQANSVIILTVGS